MEFLRYLIFWCPADVRGVAFPCVAGGTKHLTKRGRRRNAPNTKLYKYAEEPPISYMAIWRRQSVYQRMCDGSK